MGAIKIGASPKLVAAVIICLMLGVLIGINALDPAQGLTPITAIIFYVIGNGVASKSGQGVQSILEPSTKPTPDA